MPRDFRLYLADIVQSCDRISEYVYGHSFESFSASQITVDAVVRNLEIIGEAVKNVPSEVLACRPEILWTEIAKFRNAIAHEYFRIKLTVVWDIVGNELDELRSAAAVLYNDFLDPLG